MAKSLKRPLSIALGAVATTMLGGCYYGDVYGASYASGGDCSSRYGDAYYDYDGYAYDDGYGYDCYDASDYGGGFVNIGFGGGWYDDYYYPGYGMWMFDNYRNRYPLRGQYLNYWGGRRAWWKHHGGRNDWKPGRPGGWNRGDRDNDGPRGTRPGRPNRPGDGATGAPPGSNNPGRPGRPDWGGGRPRPVPQEGTAGRPRPIPTCPRPSPAMFSTPRGDRGGARPPRQRPAPSAMPDRAPRAERPAPAYRPPAQPPAPAAVRPNRGKPHRRAARAATAATTRVPIKT